MMTLLAVRELARELAGEFDRARELVRNFGSDDECSRVIINEISREISNALDIGYATAWNIAQDLAGNDDPNLACDRASTLFEYFANKLDYDLTVAQAENFGLDPKEGEVALQAFIDCYRKSARLADVLEEVVGATGAQTCTSTSRPPGRFAHFMIILACRFLPASHRVRYAAEFHSELYELPRRRRIGHAVRILRSAPSIRASIRSTPIAEREGL